MTGRIKRTRKRQSSNSPSSNAKRRRTGVHTLKNSRSSRHSKKWGRGRSLEDEDQKNIIPTQFFEEGENVCFSLSPSSLLMVFRELRMLCFKLLVEIMKRGKILHLII